MTASGGSYHSGVKHMLGELLVAIAAILFLLAAIGVPEGGRIQLGWLGAFFAALALLAPALG